jgi:hypothetical protein
VPQGAIISPVLFNVYLDSFLRKLHSLKGWDVKGFTVQKCVLAYADDLAIHLPAKHLGIYVRDFCIVADGFGLKIGPKKC